MELTYEDIQKALINSKEDILKDVIDNLKERMVHDIKYSSNDAVEKAIKEFIDKEIVPEIKKTLNANKETLLIEMNRAAITVGTEVAKMIVTKSTTNLTGYRGNEILKKLME